MSFMRVSISFVDATETGNALVVDSPSTRQNRVSVVAMEGGRGNDAWVQMEEEEMSV